MAWAVLAENGGFMILKGKWDFRYLSPRSLFVTGASIAVMVALTCITLVAAASWDVTIVDNGEETTVKTYKMTVGEVLDEVGIVLSEHDICSAGSEDLLSQTERIDIKRAFPVTVSDAQVEKTVYTALGTVGEVLEQHGIALDQNDEIVPAVEEQVEPGSVIEISRVEVVEVAEERTLGYETVEKATDHLEKGKTEIVTEGQNGLEKVTYRVTMKNGVETEREQIATEVVSEPVDKVVAVGTKVSQPQAVTTVASRGGSADTRGARVITCRATAYDGSYETLGKSNPKTALGKTPTVGTVAVDPSVIPLGSRLYIETVDGSWSYGECYAGDTGVSGYHVDLFMASRSQALSFGSRQVNVYILD